MENQIQIQYQIFKANKNLLMIGLLEHQRRSLNSAVRFLHLGLQLVAAYWAVFIDGMSCQEPFVTNVTYFAYALVAFNIVLIVLFNKFCTDKSRTFAYYAPLIVNLGLIAGILYFTIQGYLNSTACAPARALYQFFFIECVIALALFALVIFANVSWADRYSHWPGNLAWPILFLKVGFSSGFRIPAIVIGAVFAFISVTSLILNCIHYKTGDTLKDHKQFSLHWTLSMILMFATQVLAIVMLVMNPKSGDYWYQYARAIFVIFAAVNLVDFFFWFYGYRRLSAWSLHNNTVV